MKYLKKIILATVALIYASMANAAIVTVNYELELDFRESDDYTDAFLAQYFGDSALATIVYDADTPLSRIVPTNTYQYEAILEFRFFTSSTWGNTSITDDEGWIDIYSDATDYIVFNSVRETNSNIPTSALSDFSLSTMQNYGPNGLSSGTALPIDYPSSPARIWNFFTVRASGRTQVRYEMVGVTTSVSEANIPAPGSTLLMLAGLAGMARLRYIANRVV
ncbi:hypothetical protein [Alteromonas gilva]|uniref:PEP-CTERM protein-sorting domain-containing protein n=1 Tax=Alteromonas gilva TaxID=2987522 RepID=A0ABT5L766_9ALTE|nr:hypothetical protein [Alteromonas gilva]MDC8832876.1 hypothetical protein [Alteromonas gilva]